MSNKQVEGNVVLVVDDDEINLQVAKMILEKKLPCRVLIADNGHQGLEILRRQYVRVVLLDIMMPDFDGIATLREIRADKNLKNITVMMLTASTDRDNIKNAIALNVKDYIRKPFLPEELIARVKKKLVIKEDGEIEKILIIDEDERNSQALKKILEEHFPHEVVTANTGIKGMEVLRETEISLVIAGTAMRFINGFRILDFMNKDSRLKKIPAILTTQEDSHEIIEKIEMSEANDFITLPFDAEKIVATVSKTLGNSF